MAVFRIEKVVSVLPAEMVANCVYAVRVGEGFDLHITDSTGAVAHQINGYVLPAPATPVKSAAYTAAAWEHVLVDSAAAAGNFAVTMPASPSVGQQVRVTLINDHATRLVTLAGNGSNKIEAGVISSPGKYALVLEGDSVTLEWVGGGCGWAVIHDGITPHSAQITPGSEITTNGNLVWTKASNLTVASTNIGNLHTTDKLTLRRPGVYAVSASIAPKEAVTDQAVYIGAVYHGGALHKLHQMRSPSTAASVNSTVNFQSSLTAANLELYFYAAADRGVKENPDRVFLSAAEIR